MLTIQSLLKNVYWGIRNISKKSYRDCAVIISGFLVLALISLNVQAFGGTGKNKTVPKECSVLKGKEENNAEEEKEGIGLLVAPETIAVCKTAIEEQNQSEPKGEIQKREREVVKECINLETVEQIELPKAPVNPYQDLQLSEKDYEALWI